jgi:hypothetical protein
VKGTQKKQTNKIELRYDLILYPQRYVGNLEFVLSTGMQKKKKLWQKKSFELRCDLILYLQRYVGNLEIILSTVTPSFKAIRANMIVHMEKRDK